MKFEDFYNKIIESKQVGIIYHYTTINSAMKILKDMKLKDFTFNRGYVSFSRNGSGISGRGSNFLRFTIDGNKLSNKYSITPDSQAISGDKKLRYKSHKKKQAEERIYKIEVDITESLLSIDILNDYKNDEITPEELKKIESKTKLNLVDKFKPYR